MQYTILNPETIHRDDHGSVERKQNALWDAFEAQREGVTHGCGCYIFAVSAGKGYRPWYVGKAGKQAFRNECFSPHKLATYRGVMQRYGRGRPILFLVVRETERGKLSKPSKSGHRDIDFLETLLIGQSLRANAELANIQGTKLLRDMTVPGLINGPRGKPLTSVSAFKRLLNL